MDISVVISTYNRCDLLDQCIPALLNQITRGLEYEIVMVNNNSTDRTAEKIQAFQARDSRVRYILESRQGIAYGRNAGIQATSSDLLVFTDDDVRVPADWLQNTYDALLRYPAADFVGGKVLPIWTKKPAAWLAPNMAPLALQDRGEQPVLVSLENQMCLIGASLGVRRRAFVRAGLFDPATQRVKNTIGSTEDADWEIKVCQKGGHGMYVPDIVCYCEVPPERMTKAYHRRWHLGHGKFNELARRTDIDGARYLFGVPLFCYRQTLNSFAAVLLYLLFGKARKSFEYETQFLFFASFIWHRWKTGRLARAKTAGSQTQDVLALDVLPQENRPHL